MEIPEITIKKILPLRYEDVVIVKMYIEGFVFCGKSSAFSKKSIVLSYLYDLELLDKYFDDRENKQLEKELFDKLLKQKGITNKYKVELEDEKNHF